MKKFVSMISVFVLTCCLTISVTSFALADEIRGSTAGKTTFRFHAFESNAVVSLSSCEGLAFVEKRSSFLPGVQGYANEWQHGFYQVSVRGDDGYRNAFFWIPSATTWKSGDSKELDVSIFVHLPYAGWYTITISPLDPDTASHFWRVDTLKSWTEDATWQAGFDGIDSASYVY